MAKGCYLGFRKMNDSGHGNWVARAMQDGSEKEIYRSLGDLSGVPDHLRFDAAQKSAQAWFKHLGRGGASGITRVEETCERYVRHLRTTKGERAARDAEARFKNYVLNDPRLGATDLTKLTPARLDAWRTALHEMPTRSGPQRGKRRTNSTLNRDMSCFRAALNLAYDEGLVTSDFAWRSKLRPIKNADRRRETYLDRAQRRNFIEKACPDTAEFLHGLALLPLRPGALAGLKVGDYDRRLQVLKIGKDKSGIDRKIKLPAVTAQFLNEASKNKMPAAPLLSRSDGKAWNKDAWKWPVKAAAAAAELPPGTTAYTMRHSVISDLVHDGLDLLTVAQLSGTSVAMIERHYGHLRSDVAAVALARLAL
jgi:site-specific recombinase XerD